MPVHSNRQPRSTVTTQVELSLIQKIAVWSVPVLFAITVHEVAHGWVAKRLGDPTAMMLGRLTLNPVKHIDPVGTILVPAIALILAGFVFGWAKPVPVTWRNLKHPKRDMVLVALAGPAANLLMAVGWALVLRVSLLYHESMAWITEPLIWMGIAGVFVNCVLLLVNLLPIPPLDGGRILTGILPGRLAYQVSRIEPFGIFVVLALFMTGVVNILVPTVYLSAALAGSPVGVYIDYLTALMGGR